MKRREFLASAAILALVGCGGDEKPPVTGGPAPTPTPPPTPTPTPTPTPSPPPDGWVRPTATDPYLWQFLTDLHVEGGDPSRRYLINYETMHFASAGLHRISIVLHDWDAGLDVARWRFQSTTGERVPRDSSILLFGDQLPTQSGITAFARVNWDRIDWTRQMTQYATPEQSGVRAERVLSREEIVDRFAREAEPKVRLTVGGGATSATHFNSFAAAVASLYIPDSPLHRALFPCSDIAAFSNQVLIECVDDAYSERIVEKKRAGISEGLLIPPFVTLRGRGDTRLFVSDTDAPVLEAPFSFRLEGMVLENLGEGYAIHIDHANGQTRRAPFGKGDLYFPLASVMKNSEFRGSSKQATWLLGCGISNGQLIKLEGCKIRLKKAVPGLGIHNSPGMSDLGRVEVTDCDFNDNTIPGATAISLLKSFPQEGQHPVQIRNTVYSRIENQTLVGSELGFRLV